MIASIRWNHDFLSCFKQGQQLYLPGPICLLVGECGSGKSTLLRLLSKGSNLVADVEYGEALPAFLHDFERDSPRTRPMSSWRNADDAAACLSSAQMSHGQANLRLLEELNDKSDCLLLLDEPESGLSPSAVVRLTSKIQEAAFKRGCRIVCATHSPLMALLVGQVFDLGQMRERKATDWLADQGVEMSLRQVF